MQLLPLFVFGTLRRGHSNHHFLQGRFERCEPARVEGFRRGVAGHGFPAALPAPGEAIDGELFWIAPAQFDAVLRDIDQLEDLPTDALVGPYYRRAKVLALWQDGAVIAWAYVAPETPVDANDCVIPPSGPVTSA
jgi:gamma-glutamylcyclotransferase (GGCT)/AIG2-like uncharacterized protein YtfP